jgi:hypothetical protein
VPRLSAVHGIPSSVVLDIGGRKTVVCFASGTVHRLVNISGDLRLLVLMQNAGRPGTGDAVLTVSPSVPADPARRPAATYVPAEPGSAGGRRSGPPECRQVVSSPATAAASGSP